MESNSPSRGKSFMSHKTNGFPLFPTKTQYNQFSFVVVQTLTLLLAGNPVEYFLLATQSNTVCFGKVLPCLSMFFLRPGNFLPFMPQTLHVHDMLPQRPTMVFMMPRNRTINEPTLYNRSTAFSSTSTEQRAFQQHPHHNAL